MVLTGEEKKAYNRAYYQANKGKNKCEHGKNKSICKYCGGIAYCGHNKQKSICKECGGGSICEHNKRKSRCKDCVGSEICEHNKQKTSCKKCGSLVKYCEHKIQKSFCKECGGRQICEHNKQKSSCKECNGSSICEHNKQKYTCIECKGRGTCEHNKQKRSCKECLSLGEYLVNLQRINLRRVLNETSINKTKPSIEYLGCSVEYFIEYLKSKMTNEMTFDNIHIDHIKPVSRFNLDKEDEFLDCVHFTNFQALLPCDNLNKHNKWSDVDEVFWNENIKGKEYKQIYMPV